MNKEELNANLKYFYDNEKDIGITVYVILQDGNASITKKLDIASPDLPELRSIYIQSIKDRITAVDNLSVLLLSSSDERKNVIYEYDLEIPQALNALDVVVRNDELPKFDLTSDDVQSVTALLIEIGNEEKQVVLYKAMASINIFGLSSFFLKKSKTRFEKVKEEFIRLSPSFQLLKINGTLFVIDLKAIERLFGFHDVIKREAKLGLATLESKLLLENIETLYELADDITFARKFTKLTKGSPVLNAGIPNEKIISFCKNYPSLKGRIKFNANQDKIFLDTKVSRDLLLKLLMDDFLKSELTNHNYISLAKDEDKAGV